MKLLFVIIFLLVFTETAYGYSDEVCMTMDGVPLAEIRQRLEAAAKKKAMEKLIPSKISCKTKVSDYQLDYNEIKSDVEGKINFSSHEPENGESFGKFCLRFEASLSEEYIKKIQPKKVSGKGTVTDGEMSTARERAITKAKLDALYNENIKLKNLNKSDILALLTEVKIKEEQKDGYYQTEIEGTIIPLEIDDFLESQATSTQEPKAGPAVNQQVNRQERGRERFNCSDIRKKGMMGAMYFSSSSQEEDIFYKQHCQGNTTNRRRK